MPERADAEENHRGGGSEHECPEPQAASDDSPHHLADPSVDPLRMGRSAHSSTPNSVPYSSDPPTVTTAAPTGGPDERSAWSPLMSVTSMGARMNTSGRGLV